MRVLYFIIVFIHALFHLHAFGKGIGLGADELFTLPVSKPMGAVWLIAAILFFIYGISHLLRSKYARFIGIVAVVTSQLLIMMFWVDAGMGTIANILILGVTVASLRDSHFHKKIQQERARLLQNEGEIENRFISESDLNDLPVPVVNWLRSSGAVDHPFVHVGEVTQSAEMKLNPGQDKWMHATAKQYTTIDNPSFIWTVDVKMNRWLSFQGRDKYENGKGEMWIQLNALFNIVNDRGGKIDVGSLQRYLGEMVWFPSLALSPYITWEQIDDTSAKATMNYKGVEGSGSFYFDDHGCVTKFSAKRYKGNDAAAKKYEWTMDISDYKTFEGIKVPAVMTSTWGLDEGDWTWLKLEVTGLKYNAHVQQKTPAEKYRQVLD